MGSIIGYPPIFVRVRRVPPANLTGLHSGLLRASRPIVVTATRA